MLWHVIGVVCVTTNGKIICVQIMHGKNIDANIQKNHTN